MNNEITIVDITKWSKKPNNVELLLTEIQVLWTDIQKTIDLCDDLDVNYKDIKTLLQTTLEESKELIKEN